MPFLSQLPFQGHYVDALQKAVPKGVIYLVEGSDYGMGQARFDQE